MASPAAPPPAPPRTRPKRTQDDSLKWASPGTTTTPTQPTAAAATQETAEAEAPTRDLAEELRGMISNPSACFTKRTVGSGPSNLTLSISATVTPSGIINRAQVSGSSLTDEESACLEAMVVRARFRSPVDEAPTTVRATVELREKAPAKKTP